MAYLSYGIKAFMQQLSYRTEVWLSVLGNFVMIFIQVSIWEAVIGKDSVNGITLEHMITYSIINTIILSLLLTDVFKSVDTELKTGGISIYLIKPINYPLFLISENIGQASYRFVFTAIPTFFICWIVFGFSLPPSFVYGIAFIISIFVCIILSFLLGYLIALISFWFLTTFALEWSLSALMIVFSGSFFPLWFFPPFWERLATMLPFPYLGFVPAAIYLGEVEQASLISVILVGLGWVLVLSIVVVILWRWAIKRLVIQGG